MRSEFSRWAPSWLAFPRPCGALLRLPPPHLGPRSRGNPQKDLRLAQPVLPLPRPNLWKLPWAVQGGVRGCRGRSVARAGPATLIKEFGWRFQCFSVSLTMEFGCFRDAFFIVKNRPPSCFSFCPASPTNLQAPSLRPGVPL